MSCTSSGYQGASGALSFVAGQVGSRLGGSFGRAYASFLTGQNNIVANFSVLFEKFEAGTVTTEDYLSVGSAMLTTATAFGFLVNPGSKAVTAMDIAAGLAGALFIWKQTYGCNDGEGEEEPYDPGDVGGISQDPETGFPVGIGPPDGPDRFGDAENTKSPLILDLNGDGVKTLNKTAGKYFDHAGDGFAERTGWVDKDDGLLVRDLNGDGKITSGRELFGNHTLLRSDKEAANGFEALKDLDNNADGLVDDKDTAFASLRVWKDTNGNGRTDTGEFLSLAQAGVKSLKVGYTDAGSKATADAQGNQHQQLGAFTKTDGSTQNMHDVWFATSSWDTVDQRSPLALSAAIAALPEIEGPGKLGSLHQAMVRDSSGELQALVTQYTTQTVAGSGNIQAAEGIYTRTNLATSGTGKTHQASVNHCRTSMRKHPLRTL
jgi:hypothetical protein